MDMSLFAKRYFVDSSFFITLADKSDLNHPKAFDFFQTLPQSARLFTTNFILDETITRIRTLAGVEMAYQIAQDLLNSKKYRMITVDEQICLKALEKLRKYSDKILSFTDCTSFVVMEQMKIRTALAFDDDFVKVGFQVAP
ncbi:MAG: PIN domain-containing protein [Deltaproteobacteria bacterium]|nr:PIN domain-containing protein [Deltaproteobacteria bacterium]